MIKGKYIRVDSEKWKQLKSAAALNGKTISEIIRDWIDSYLKEKTKRETKE